MGRHKQNVKRRIYMMKQKALKKANAINSKSEETLPSSEEKNLTTNNKIKDDVDEELDYLNSIDDGSQLEEIKIKRKTMKSFDEMPPTPSITPASGLGDIPASEKMKTSDAWNVSSPSENETEGENIPLEGPFGRKITFKEPKDEPHSYKTNDDLLEAKDTDEYNQKIKETASADKLLRAKLRALRDRRKGEKYRHFTSDKAPNNKEMKDMKKTLKESGIDGLMDKLGIEDHGMREIISDGIKTGEIADKKKMAHKLTMYMQAMQQGQGMEYLSKLKPNQEETPKFTVSNNDDMK